MKPSLRSTAQPRRCWLCLLRSTVTPRVYRIHIFGIIQLGQVGPRQTRQNYQQTNCESQPILSRMLSGLLKSIKFRSAPQSSFQMLEGLAKRGSRGLLKCSWAAQTKGNLSNKGLSQKSSTDGLDESSHESASAVRHSAVSASAPAAIISPWMSLTEATQFRGSFFALHLPTDRFGTLILEGRELLGTGDITLQIPWNRWTLVNCFLG